MASISTAELRILITAQDFATKQLAGIVGGFNGIAARATATGAAMTRSLTLPAGLLAGSIVKEASDFEQTLNVLVNTTRQAGDNVVDAGKGFDDAGKRMSAFREEAIKLGADLKIPGISASDAARAMDELAKAGLSVTSTLGAARGTVLLAAAGNIEVEKAADLASAALKQFGLQGRDMERVTNMMARATEVSRIKFEDMAVGMRQGGAAMHTLGVPLEGFLAILGALVDRGVSGGVAATSLRRAISAVAAPTAKASAEMAKYNIELFDAQGKFIGFPALVDELNDSLGNLPDKEKFAAIKNIFGQEGFKSIAPLLTAAKGGSEALQELADQFAEGEIDADQYAAALEKLSQSGLKFSDQLRNTEKDIANSNAAELIGEARMKGLNGALEGLHSTLSTVAVLIGTPFLERLNNMTQGFSNVALSIGKFLEANPRIVEMAAAFGLVVAAVGPGLFIFGKLLTMLLALATPLGALTLGVALFAGAWSEDFMGIQHITDNVLSSVHDALDRTGQDLAGWASNAGDAGGAVSKGLSGLSGLVLAFQFAMQQNWPAARAAWDQALTDFDASLGHASVAMGNFTSTILNEIGRMVGIDVSGVTGWIEKLGALAGVDVTGIVGPLAQFQAILAKLGDTTIGGLADVIATLQGFTFTSPDLSGLQRLQEIAAFDWNQFITFLTTLGQVMTTLQVPENLASGARDFAAALQSIYDAYQIVAGIQMQWAALLPPSDAASQATALGLALGVLGATWATMGAGALDFANNVKAIALGLSVASEAVLQFTGNLQQVFQGTRPLSEVFDVDLSGVLATVQTQIDQLVAQNQDAVRRIQTVWSTLWTNITGMQPPDFGAMFNSAVAAISSVFSNISSAVMTAITGIIATVSTLPDQISTMATSAFTGLLASATSGLTAVVTYVTGTFGTMFTAAFVSIFPGISAGFLTFWNGLSSEAQAALTNLGNIVQTAMGALPGIIQGFLTQIIAAITAWGAQTAATWTQTLAAWNATIQIGMTAIGSAIDSGLQTAQQFIQGFITIGESLWNNFSTIVVAIVTGLVNTITSLIETIGAAISALAGPLQTAEGYFNTFKANVTSILAGLISSAASQAAAIGSTIVSGLSGAISAGVTNVANAAASLVTSAINAARGAADAHSPSRKMVELGQDMIDGLAETLAHGQSRVADAVKIIIQEALKLNIDPLVALALAKAESALNPRAIGDRGHSVGLFQLHDQGQGAGMSVAERQDPLANARHFLTQHAQLFQQLRGEITDTTELVRRFGVEAEQPADRTGNAYAAAYQQIQAEIGDAGGALAEMSGNEDQMTAALGRSADEVASMTPLLERQLQLKEDISRADVMMLGGLQSIARIQRQIEQVEGGTLQQRLATLGLNAKDNEALQREIMLKQALLQAEKNAPVDPKTGKKGETQEIADIKAALELMGDQREEISLQNQLVTVQNQARAFGLKEQALLQEEALRPLQDAKFAMNEQLAQIDTLNAAWQAASANIQNQTGAETAARREVIGAMREQAGANANISVTGQTALQAMLDAGRITQDEFARYTSILQQFGGTVSQTSVAGAQGITQIGTAVGTTGQAVATANQQLNTGAQQLANYGQAGAEAGQMIAQTGVRGIEEFTIAAGNAAQAATVGVVNALNAQQGAVYNAAYSVGAAVGDGLANGVIEHGNAAINAAIEVANQVILAMRVAFDAHSPARQSYFIGQDVMDGLLLGLQNPNVADTIKNRIQQYINSAQQYRNLIPEAIDNEMRIIDTRIKQAKALLGILDLEFRMKAAQQRAEDAQRGGIDDQVRLIELERAREMIHVNELVLAQSLNNARNITTNLEREIATIQAGSLADRLRGLDLEQSQNILARERIGIERRLTQIQQAGMQDQLDAYYEQGLQVMDPADETQREVNALHNRLAAIDTQNSMLEDEGEIMRLNGEIASYNLRVQAETYRETLESLESQQAMLEQASTELQRQSDLIIAQNNLRSFDAQIEAARLEEEHRGQLRIIDDLDRQYEALNRQKQVYDAILRVVDYLHDLLIDEGIIGDPFAREEREPTSTSGGKSAAGRAASGGSAASRAATGMAAAREEAEKTVALVGNAQAALAKLPPVVSATTQAAAEGIDTVTASAGRILVTMGTINSTAFRVSVDDQTIVEAQATAADLQSSVTQVTGQTYMVSINGTPITVTETQATALQTALTGVEAPIDLVINGQAVSLSAEQVVTLQGQMQYLNTVRPTLSVEDQAIQDANMGIVTMGQNLQILDDVPIIPIVAPEVDTEPIRLFTDLTSNTVIPMPVESVVDDAALQEAVEFAGEVHDLTLDDILDREELDTAVEFAGTTHPMELDDILNRQELDEAVAFAAEVHEFTLDDILDRSELDQAIEDAEAEYEMAITTAVDTGELDEAIDAIEEDYDLEVDIDITEHHHSEDDDDDDDDDDDERAAGGPVRRGKVYTVGERGREFFIPNTSGVIVPNDLTDRMLDAAAARSLLGSGGGAYSGVPVPSRGQMTGGKVVNNMLELHYVAMNQERMGESAVDQVLRDMVAVLNMGGS